MLRHLKLPPNTWTQCQHLDSPVTHHTAATNIEHLSLGYRGSGKTKHTNKNRLELVYGLERDSRHWWTTVSEESLGMSEKDFSVSFF